MDEITMKMIGAKTVPVFFTLDCFKIIRHTVGSNFIGIMRIVANGSMALIVKP